MFQTSGVTGEDRFLLCGTYMLAGRSAGSRCKHLRRIGAIRDIKQGCVRDRTGKEGTRLPELNGRRDSALHRAPTLVVTQQAGQGDQDLVGWGQW